MRGGALIKRSAVTPGKHDRAAPLHFSFRWPPASLPTPRPHPPVLSSKEAYSAHQSPCPLLYITLHPTLSLLCPPSIYLSFKMLPALSLPIPPLPPSSNSLSFTRLSSSLPVSLHTLPVSPSPPLFLPSLSLPSLRFLLVAPPSPLSPSLPRFLRSLSLPSLQHRLPPQVRAWARLGHSPSEIQSELDARYGRVGAVLESIADTP